jgi:uncharacterized membrane protein YcaP (DUF421 family)
MEIVFRITLIYVFIFLAMRVMGKREFSKMSPMEFITLLLIPEIVSQGMVGDDFSITNALVGLASLFVLVYVISTLAHVSERFEKTVTSTPTVLVHGGRLLEANLNRERVSPDEIYGEIRRAGLERIEQVRWAVLESEGTISIVAEPSSS